jgi:hypothetical protein
MIGRPPTFLSVVHLQAGSSSWPRGGARLCLARDSAQCFFDGAAAVCLASSRIARGREEAA